MVLPTQSVQPPVVRFAPSPNGYLHLGHAYSALTGARFAHRHGGRFLLRIEDLDTQRSNPTLVDAILDDLAWLGLTWEQPVLRQSEHAAVYQAAAARLLEMGVLYPCFASRADIAAAADPIATDPDGAPLYPAALKFQQAATRAEKIERGEKFALRLDMAKALALAAAKTSAAPVTFTEFDADGIAHRVAGDPARWGDAVIVRKDAPSSYHLAVVVDDARQGITHVTRGRDLFAATGLHRLLQVLLDAPEPVYHHHSLITTPDGRKLAKSKGDTSLATLRQRGMSPSDIRAELGFADDPT